MGLHRMAKGELPEDAVNVSPPVALAFQYAASLKFRDDLLNGTLGDANGGHYVPQAHFRVLGETKKDMGVIGEERPARGRSAGRNIFFHFGVDG